MKNKLELLKNITSYLNPLGVFIFLISGIFIALFFGISRREWIKNFIFVFVCLLLIGAFFINIYGYITKGEFSSSLFTSGIFETFETALILFFAVICLAIIFIFNRRNAHFVKIIMIFLFSLISVLVLVISKNFMSFFISIGCFLIAFFALATISNDSRMTVNGENIKESKALLLQSGISRSMSRFFIASLFFMVLLFFGFSILYGVSDVKNFLQLYQDIESSGINIILSLIIVSIAFYFYLGIFPFQAPYINFSNKAEPSSLYLLWLFYFPAGIIALLKFTPIISILNKNLKAGSYILYILLIAVFLGSTGSGIAGLKTKSLRKIASYIFTLIFTGYFINMAMLITGFIKDDNLSWLNIYYLAFIALNFLPLAFIFSFIENASKKDSVDSLRSLVYKDKFIGIAFLISMFSLIGIPGLFGYPGKKYYIDLIINIFKADTNGLTSIQGWLILIIVIIYIAAFTAVSLRLIILLFMKENKDTDTISQYNFSKAFYVLIGIFMVLILFFGIIGLLETLNPGINLLGSRITNSAIFTKNLK